MPTAKTLLDLPADPEALKALLSSLLLERDEQRQRADELAQRAVIQESLRQSLELKVEQLQHELELLKKRYYGPRADRLRSMAELGQLLLAFSEELAAKPVNAGDVATDAKSTEPECELRWVRRRKGRRNLAAFENLPVQTIVHELSAEERVCGLRRHAAGDRCRNFLADRIHSGALRTHRACAQEVCLRALRSRGSRCADHGGR